MAWHDWGNKPIKSTTVSANNPSTATLIAEIDSTQLASIPTNGWQAEVKWAVGVSTGASTGVVFVLEQALSTGLGSTAQRDVTSVSVLQGQTAEFVFPYFLESGDRLRARITSTFTGEAYAKIVVVAQT